MFYFNQIIELEGIAGKLIFKEENYISLIFVNNEKCKIEFEKASFDSSKVKIIYEEANFGKTKFRRIARAYNTQ